MILLTPENIDQILDFADVNLELVESEFLPAVSGGVSGLLWKLGRKRVGSPRYVGTVEQP